MSASTRTKSASPPRRSIVSGEVASSRERPGSGGAAVFVIGRSGFTLASASASRARAVEHGSRVAPRRVAAGTPTRVNDGRRRRRDNAGGAVVGGGGWRSRWRRGPRGRRLVRLAPRARRRLGPRRGRRGWGRLGSSVLRERRAGGNRARAAHGDEYRCLPQQRSTRARHVAFPLRPTTLGPKRSEPASRMAWRQDSGR